MAQSTMRGRSPVESDYTPPGSHRLTENVSDRGRNTESMMHESRTKSFLLDRVQMLWMKTGITWPTYKMMFKGALAPTIAVALFQADAYAHHFTTVGYLVGVMSILSMVMQPRAKFLQTMLMNVLFICFSAAVVSLALYCCVRARVNSGGSSKPGRGGPGTSGSAASGAETARYNSSASTVAGVWLMVLVYLMSTIRARRQELMIPAMAASIFSNVAMVYAPQFSTMVQAEAFIRRFLEALLTGFAIGTGVSLLVFPLTSRTIVFRDMGGQIDALRSALKANMDYVHSLEEGDMFAFRRTETVRHRLTRSPEAQAVKDQMQTLGDTNSKLNGDLPFAKREIAFGYLGPDDLKQLAKLLRMIMVPLIGLSCLSDVFERISEDRGWDTVDSSVSTDPNKLRAVTEWHELTKLLREPFQAMADTIDDGLEHVVIVLRLRKRSKKATSTDDVEAKQSSPRPGDNDYPAYLEKQTSDFHHRRQAMLTAWCRVRGIDLPEGFFTDPKVTADFKDPEWLKLDFDSDIRLRSRRQLYICLYMEFLLWHIGKRVYDLVAFVEAVRASGKLDKRRLVVPGSKRLKKWVRGLFRPDSGSQQDQHAEGSTQTSTVYLGQAYNKRKDPMHLSPQNTWERFGNRIRKLSRFLASQESVFGFRVAIATMCIAVVAYLRDTQVFYTQQRLFWAQIMVSIGMQPTAGQSLRTSLFRIIGTAMFLLAAWICWYIVDGHPPGVLIFYFIFLHIGPWIMLKQPAYTTLGVIGPITLTLILGYELQVLKIGIATATSNGQAYYPVYILGPIRLATVMGGLFLGWLWTIFPYPISEHAEQRKSLGSGLYLMANYYSVLHETVRARLRGLDDDPTVKGSVGQRLEKARRTIFVKSNLVLSNMRTRTAFIKFDIPIGGKFPREQYETIIEQMQSTLNFMALVSYASTAFNDMQAQDNERENQSQWLQNFRKLIGETNVTSQSITTLLSLMSASVAGSQPLPPYLRVPEPFQYSKKLDEMDRDILRVQHVIEPGYASFAVIQLGTKCIIDDLKNLLESVKELVGELDFSYHVVSTTDEDANASEETLTFSKPVARDMDRSKTE